MNRLLTSLFGRNVIVGKPKDTEPKKTYPELSGVDRGEARYRLAGYTYKERPKISGLWNVMGVLVFFGVTVGMVFSGDTGSYISMICVNPIIGFVVSLPFFIMTALRVSAGR